MVAPAAHTSKGLAKAFVSSAGGKGPENRDTPAPLIVHAEARGCPLPCASRAAAASKVLLCRKDVCRVVPPGYAPLCQKGYLEQGLSVGAACRRLWVQAQCGSWRPWVAISDKAASVHSFPVMHVGGRQAERLPGPATSTEGAGPPRKRLQNLGAPADTSRRNRAGYTTA